MPHPMGGNAAAPCTQRGVRRHGGPPGWLIFGLPWPAGVFPPSFLRVAKVVLGPCQKCVLTVCGVFWGSSERSVGGRVAQHEAGRLWPSRSRGEVGGHKRARAFGPQSCVGSRCWLVGVFFWGAAPGPAHHRVAEKFRLPLLAKFLPTPVQTFPCSTGAEGAPATVPCPSPGGR